MLPRRPSLTENKLLLLYTLDRLGPVTAEQLLLFFVDHNLMDYITLQLALAELCEAELLVKHAHESGVLYRLSAEGLHTLELFRERIPFSRLQCVDEAATAWRVRFARERQVLADYEPVEEGEYAVRLRILEEDMTLMDLSLRLPERERAIHFCNAWTEKAGALYAHLMRELDAQEEP
ncbi:MAG TPA: DUF4364 family protein [Clostridia bacterium]|nr:DUF4364 family protein [Clostridia bacterium]